MRRKLILAFLIGVTGILPAHAEWIVSVGTVIVIDGIEYVVNDRCGIDNCIDIFMEDYDAAIRFGRQDKEIYIKR